MVNFEWDPKKSHLNKEKHGVSFSEAVGIWQGAHLTIDTIAKSEDGETRCATIGLVGDTLHTAIWTMRGEKIRIISVRRARDGEKKAYWKAF